ncbi:leucine-rich repeat and immunoglobulin-like domain-containing nogo receptor-interacting protein 3 [Branchiostoma floridae]|uniref:Leucine-rich repeat and immunoglobulin-like domain-containing nogo receptor-interacting protein 3 n=1 Tax=Branchiostoma floridae TaxID=7739 RepID=A0A9J7N858_BRAFL|nr:leucine-rich repeat and immunoglobulin-like domain-containing nogo receptor-interacting protein 3 [Branchiostoma floridae]
MSRLQSLDLCFNQIRMIPPRSFANLKNLKKLLLISNKVTMIQAGTFANLPQLQELKLDSNSIATIQTGSFANLPRLESLWLCHNQITNIQAGLFANLPRLEYLTLSNNKITKIHAGAFVNLNHFKRLTLQMNPIRTIQAGAFTGLPRVEVMWLSRNKITMIQAGAFADLKHLERLVLNSNQITTIHSGAFSNLPKLRCLELWNNKMSAIAPLAFGLLPSNLIIKLDRNPWQCDCKMLLFWLDSTEFPSVKYQIICAQPAKFRGQKLASINRKKMACEEPTMTTLPADAKVTCSNHYNGTASETGGPEIKTNRPRTTIASPFQTSSDRLESKDFHADTPVASNNYNNDTPNSLGTPASSTGSPKGKRGKTRATLASPLQITSDKPASNSSSQSAPSFPSPVLIASICVSIAGIVLIGSTILIIWCKRRTSLPPLGPNVD